MFATTIPPVVGGVVTGMPAYKAGLKEGDRILAIDGQPVQVWSDLLRALRGRVDQPVQVSVQRDSRQFTLTVKPINPEGRRGSSDARIGIEPPAQGSYLLGRYPFPEALRVGAGATVAMVANVYGGMWLTISRPIYYREYLGGPMFIAQAASESARRGFDSYLQFLALINIAIMAFNLLPIPVLDGGHILLALFQAVRGQAISARAYVRFQKVGLVFIGTLFVLILANDPLRWMQRQRALERAPQEGQVAPSPP
jgi:regulator of sigma E protease